MPPQTWQNWEVSTAIIAKIGEDGFGKLKGVLDDNNINTDGLVDSDIPSSAVVTIGSDSERTAIPSGSQCPVYY